MVPFFKRISCLVEQPPSTNFVHFFLCEPNAYRFAIFTSVFSWNNLNSFYEISCFKIQNLLNNPITSHWSSWNTSAHLYNIWHLIFNEITVIENNVMICGLPTKEKLHFFKLYYSNFGLHKNLRLKFAKYKSQNSTFLSE